MLAIDHDGASHVLASPMQLAFQQVHHLLVAFHHDEDGHERYEKANENIASHKAILPSSSYVRNGS